MLAKPTVIFLDVIFINYQFSYVPSSVLHIARFDKILSSFLLILSLE